MRNIPSGESPAVERRRPVDPSTTVGPPSSSRPASSELEVALLGVFQSVGLPLPTEVEDLARASDSSKILLMFTLRSSTRAHVVIAYTNVA
jgi:hypothetical protein